MNECCGQTVQLCIRNGATFFQEIFYLDPDGEVILLTDFTGLMEIRSSYTSDEIILSLTTENGRILIDEEFGRIYLLISATDTLDLDPLDGAVGDLYLIGPDGYVYSIVSFIFNIVRTTNVGE